MRWSGGSREQPERFGKGAIEGVAGPESANNSAVAGGMIPLLSLGLSEQRRDRATARRA